MKKTNQQMNNNMFASPVYQQKDNMGKSWVHIKAISPPFFSPVQVENRRKIIHEKFPQKIFTHKSKQ